MRPYLVLVLAFYLPSACAQACVTNSVISVHDVFTGSPDPLPKLPLVARTANGHFASKVMGEYRLEGSAFEATWHHESRIDEAGLPYHISSWELLIDGEQVFTQDFTSGCRGFGVAIFPGAHFSAKPVIIPRAHLDKCSHSCMVRVRIWGHF